MQVALLICVGTGSNAIRIVFDMIAQMAVRILWHFSASCTRLRRLTHSQGICSTSIIVLAHLNLMLGAMETENRISTIRFSSGARPSRQTFTTASSRAAVSISRPETDATEQPPENSDRGDKAHELGRVG